MLPPRMAAMAAIRFDAGANQAILRGLPQECQLVADYFASVDQEQPQLAYSVFPLEHLQPKTALEILPQRYRGNNPLVAPGNDALLLQLPSTMHAEASAWLAAVDRQRESHVVKLNYIKPETLLAGLPSGFAASEFSDTGDGSTLIFHGSQARFGELLGQLRSLDKARTQITYQLLIVQYEKSDKTEWSRELGTRRLAVGDRPVLLGALSGLLSLNFDIVSAFGYLFALKLNLDLADNKARVFADTTLNGLSGQDIKFQNTTTYRYRELSPDSGDSKAVGVTREISSGLLLNLNGWVSGDGMITMAVQATVSKRGTDMSTNTGNPPSTSERIVTTTVRTRSGEPVILTGLIQNDAAYAVSGLPWLARLPLVGALFGNRKSTGEESEMRIYIVPRVETATASDDSVPLERIHAVISGEGRQP